MAKPHCEPLLRAWGYYYGEHAPSEWEEDASLGPHPIARAMEFAGGDSAPAGRSARAALRTRNRGIKSARVQSWGFDPVRAVETHTHRIAVPEDIPLQVQRVQNLALALHAFDTLRGTVLRYEYCTRGPQADKAARLVLVGLPCSLRQYREALAFALGWIESKLTP